MNQLDVLYRALTDYRKNTKDDRDCITQRSAIISANAQDDLVEVIRNTCKIEEDWIEAIEKGLEFIEKCINEERQFIRSNGEIIPIEKVKRVSKDSVEHLARHSNLLTREPEEGDDVVPDSLYTVERLSDYAVYENRFLYMLLCYLRDFISMRYERIVEATNTYSGKMTMNKVIVETNRRIEYEVKLVEEKKNDEYLRSHNEAQEIIDKILLLYKAVVHFLNTPLMNEVSKSPMLKPPVTRTNVLRMNKNFRQALALYEYITAYDKDGYEIITNKKTLSPFVGAVADEIAETVELSSFLTYEHGLGINGYFKRNWQREEDRRREEEQKKHAEQLKNIRKHLKDGEVSPEEYILMLEKRISDLEENAEDVISIRAMMDELADENEKLTFKLKTARERINFLEDEIIRLNHKYEEDMRAEKLRHAEEIRTLTENYENEIASINEAHAQEIERINLEHAEEVERINIAHAEEIEQINTAHAQAIEQINLQHASEINDINVQHAEEIGRINEAHTLEVTSLTEKYTGEIKEITSSMQKMRGELEREIVNRNYIIAKERMEHRDELEKEYKKRLEDVDTIVALKEKCVRLDDLKTLAEGRLMAIRVECGLVKPDEKFNTEEKTDELEHQYLVFKKFFKNEWKKTKKDIKKDAFDKVKAEEAKFQEEKKQKKSGVEANSGNAVQEIKQDNADKKE